MKGDWPAAMSPQERTVVEIEVIDRLNAWAGADGRFMWKPELIRIIAGKQAGSGYCQQPVAVLY